MALRDQPYIPLYVQDFLTDEKLIECSAASTGIYIRLLCIMHKSEEYGTILLKQKDKQTENYCLNFATKLAKQMPYGIEEIEDSLKELIDEGVITWKLDKLLQKRMIEDNRLSLIRSKAGQKGGFATANKPANDVANTEDEDEYESESEVKNGKLKEEQVMDYPTLFTYWEQNKKGGKYKNEQSRLRMMNRLFKLTRNDYDFAKKAIFHCIDSNYQGFCNGDGLYYKEKTEYQLSQEKERSKAKQKTEITGRYIPPAE